MIHLALRRLLTEAHPECSDKPEARLEVPPMPANGAGGPDHARSGLQSPELRLRFPAGAAVDQAKVLPASNNAASLRRPLL